MAHVTRLRLHLHVAAAAGFLASSVALAEDLGVVAVAPPPGPGQDLVAATEEVRAALVARNRGVLGASQLAARMAGEERAASLAELDRAFETARSAASRGDLEGSTRILGAVLEDLERGPDSAEAFRQWTRAQARLAKNEADLGRAERTRAILQDLVRTAPDVKLDPALYPPRFLLQLEEARASVRATPVRQLTVKAAGKDVRVFLNGRELGAAPVQVAVHPGTYRVSGTQGSLHAPPVTVEIAGSDAAVTLDFELLSAFRPSAGPGLALAEAGRAARVLEIGRYLKLDRLFTIGTVQEGGAQYLVGDAYELGGGAAGPPLQTREGRIRFQGGRASERSIAALADFLAGGPATADVEPRPVGLQPREPAALPGGPPPPAEKSKALGWTAFGFGVGAVALGGLSVWQALKANGKYDDAKKLLDANGQPLPGTDPATYNDLVSSGDSAKKVAIVAGVGAGVAAVTSGILGYLAYKQTGEVGPFRF